MPAVPQSLVLARSMFRAMDCGSKTEVAARQGDVPYTSKADISSRAYEYTPLVTRFLPFRDQQQGTTKAAERFLLSNWK